ncbi:MAG: RNA pyrophosphohydrolase [Rhodospirillales bacterium]|nr:RNA pyrophosphohydrolase [Rhodospirillales bacterium]
MATKERSYRDCVGIVLINGSGLVFAAERMGMPGAWQMPQGGIDKGESPEEAALRELAEETGIVDVTVLQQTREWLYYDLPEPLRKRWYRGQRQIWFAMQFDGRDSEINVEGVDDPEFVSWRWMTPTAIIDAIVDFKREVYAEVFKRFDGLTA